MSERDVIDPEDGEALRAYVRRGLRKAIRGVDEADLDDFTQDAMVRIHSRRHTFQGDSRFSTWAMAVAVRVAFSALRQRRARSAKVRVDSDLVEVLGDVARDDVGLERDSERRRLLAVVRDAIGDQLTERQRAAVLGELQGVPTEALAESLGIPRNALYKLHHDARRKLKRAILDAGYSATDVAAVAGPE